jgi:hypothetical protein
MGYLDKPLDRFVLAGLGRPGSFALRHAAVSLRVALASGPPLGLLFALAVVVVNRPRFSTIPDFLLLSLYFSVLFLAIVFALEFAAGLALSLLAQWRGRGVAAFHATAARAGLCVSLLLSAYLAFWWRRRSGGSADWRFDLAGLCALLIVNAALFRISSLASLAALIRASELPPEEHGQGARAGRVLGFVAAAVLTIGFFLAPRPAPAQAAASFEPLGIPGRLVVIAWDGLGRSMLEAASVSEQAGGGGRREAVPLGRSALWGGDPGVPRALIPLSGAAEGVALSRPAYWTEIATGRPAAEHGVGGVASRRVAGLSSPLGSSAPLGTVLTMLLPGRSVPVDATLRRAPALWDILGSKEGIAVVGWWATWPASDRSAAGRPFFVVSDRAVFGIDAPSAPERGIAPAAFAATLARERSADLEAVDRDIAERFGGDGSPPSAAIARSGRIDGYALRVAMRLITGSALKPGLEPGLRDLFLYLPGLDILQAAGAPTAGGEVTRLLSGDNSVRFGYVRFIQDGIDRIAAGLRPEDWLVIIGDPGRRGGASPGGGEDPGTALPAGAGAGGAGDGGWILISGPGCAPGISPEPWRPLDLAPTLLNLRGFPTVRDMKGTVQTLFLSPEWRARLRVRTVDSFGEFSFPPRETGVTDEDEALERLRSLGYVR